MSELFEQITETLKGMFPKGCGLHEPVFSGREKAYLNECIDTTFVSSVGKFVDRFEAELAAFCGAKRAVAVSNGTSALHICLRLMGVEPQDEVLLPALTFVATANAILYCSAVPHFVEVDEKTLGVDPAKLSHYLKEAVEMRAGGAFNKKTGRRVKAIVPMHTFGFPVDMDPLMEVCARFQIEVIEDAAESLGSYYKGRHTGTIAKVSAFSFNGNKIVTSGGGGAIVTNDERLGKLAKHITTTAKVPHRWEFVHDQLGYNYRMPNINAALACAQLEQIDGFLEKKRRLAVRYREAFAGLKGVKIFVEPEFAKSNHWLNTLILDRADAAQRDRVLQATNDAKIQTRPVWTLMNKLEYLKDSPAMPLEVSESLSERIVSLPSSVFL